MAERTCVCPECGKSFRTTHPFKKWCSRTCTVKGNNAVQNARARRDRPQQPCPGCGQLFKPPRSDSRYCSQSCKYRASYVPAPAQPIGQTCEFCGAKFTAVRSDARTCSPRCSYGLRLGREAKRTCSSCRADISHRHGNTRYCESCSEKRAIRHGEESKTCPQCGEIFTGKSRRRFCSSRCSGVATRARQLAVPEQRVCNPCGRSFVSADARKVTCSTACRQRAARRPGARIPVARSCPTCGSLFEGTHGAQKYCGGKCRGAASKRRTRANMRPYMSAASHCFACKKSMPPGKKAGAKYCGRICESRFRNAPNLFAARFGRTCDRCGDPVPDDKRVDARFCRTTCQVVWNQEVRRARKRGLPWEKIDRAEIFERDGWTCHLCSLPVTDRPTLDHLIPIAVADSPGHVWENVAAAHRGCNSGKRDRVTDHDLELFARLRAERWALVAKQTEKP